VMAKCRIGHFVEAEILQALEVDFIDESEVLTPADEENHVDKHAFTVPFVCGARNLGEALRRCGEGAAMIRTKGEAGTGDVVHAVWHMRTIMKEIRQVQAAREDELFKLAKDHQAPLELIREVHRTGKLPVPNFSAGGIATPADAALMMKLGAETVFVGSGIFKSGDPAATRARDRARRRALQRPQGDRRGVDGPGHGHRRPGLPRQGLCVVRPPRRGLSGVADEESLWGDSRRGLFE